MKLNLKFREGFANSTVSVKLGEREVYRKAGVTTDLSISFADEVDIALDGAERSLIVAVAGGPSATLQFDPAKTPFVEVWIIEGRMEIRASAQATPMM